MAINWLELWRELILANPHSENSDPIKRYKNHALKKQDRPDPLLDFVIQSINPEDTVLDIGAGSGRWSVPLAGKARSVTAVEPSSEMLAILQANLKNTKKNFKIIQSTWEDAQVETHDISVCAHAVYSSPDLSLFVRKMERQSRKACYLSIRIPPVDGVIGELSLAIYGREHDSANAVIAYNALYSLGIYANVLVEKEIFPWVNDSLDDAFVRAKKHLQLENTDNHDQLIRDTLKKRLIFSNNRYIWPDGMRSALLWWNPADSVR